MIDVNKCLIDILVATFFVSGSLHFMWLSVLFSTLT